MRTTAISGASLAIFKLNQKQRYARERLADEVFLDAVARLAILGGETEDVAVELVIEERDPQLEPVRRRRAVCAQHVVHVQVLHEPPALLVTSRGARSLMNVRMSPICDYGV